MTGDIDNDGDADVVIESFDGNVSFWINVNNHRFEKVMEKNGFEVFMFLDVYPEVYDIADFDGDGKNEVLLKDYFGNVGVYRWCE